MWTPMESGDGWIVRVQPGRRALSTDDVRSLAELTRVYGNGHLELTRRANLQIRGVTAEALPALQTELVHLRLAEATPEQERSASLLVNPLSDLDPECAILGPLAEELDRVLASVDAPRNLPSKFCIVLDGGGSAVSSQSADIRVDLRRDEEGVAYVSVGDRDNCFVPIGSCLATATPLAVMALMQTLSSLQEEGCRRMRDVVAIHGAEVVRASVAPLLLDTRRAPPARSRASVIGFKTGSRNWMGLGLPFGSGDARQWNAIAEIAGRFGRDQIRLTPHRSVAIPDVKAEEIDDLLSVARDHSLIFEESDPLLRVSACVGAPACHASFSETRTLGRELSDLVRPLLAVGATVHISGCSKSCALTGSASVTLVHDQGGCQLGLDKDVAATSGSSTMSLPAARRRLAVIARDFVDAGVGRDVSQFLRSYTALV